MSRTEGYDKTARRRTGALMVTAVALLVLAGCHYSLLNPSGSLAAWSPDGSRLAICIINEDADKGELWLVEPESGRTRKLLDGEQSSSLSHLLAPRWSPDGKRLYCARTSAGEEDERRPALIVGIDPDSGETVDAGTIHFTGNRVEHFGSTQGFVPLGDGTLAAQDLGQDHVYRLVRIDPANGALTKFAAPEGRWMVISGSLDGVHLAVAVPGSAACGTRITLFDNTGAQRPHPLDLRPASDDGSDAQPSLTWSPTADRLAIIVEEGNDDDFATLLLLETDTGNAVPVAHDVFGTPPLFSPDGRLLACAAGSGVYDGDGDQLLEVRVLNGSTSSSEVSLPGLALPLAWSADSSRLLYYLGQPDDDNTGTVISVAPNGRGTTVVSHHQQDRLAVPCPTGGRLAWVSGSGAVQVLEPGTGRRLFHAGLTTIGTLQAGEDHLRQGRPESALQTWSTLDGATLDGEGTARLAAGSYTALQALDRPGDAAALLDKACGDLPRKEDPPLAFLALGGALSDFGFRPEAERLVEEQLLTRYPESPEAVEALWALAALKQSDGEADAALRHLDRLLRSYPDERREVTRALLLAVLAEDSRDETLVIELAEMIIESNDDAEDTDQTAARSLAHFARGTALERRGDSELAEQAFAAALDSSAETHLADGRKVEDLCWEALLRLARSETTAGRR